MVWVYLQYVTLYSMCIIYSLYHVEYYIFCIVQNNCCVGILYTKENIHYVYLYKVMWYSFIFFKMGLLQNLRGHHTWSSILQHMISWHGYAFYITGPLWGESTSDWWSPFPKGQYIQSFVFIVVCAWTSCWTWSSCWWLEMPWHLCDITVKNWRNWLKFNSSPPSAHICVSKLGSIASGNGLSPVRHQAITWTHADLLSIRPLETNFSEIWIKIPNFSFKKMHLKMSSAQKWRPFCPGDELMVLSGSNKAIYNNHPNWVTSMLQLLIHWGPSVTYMHQ